MSGFHVFDFDMLVAFHVGVSICFSLHTFSIKILHTVSSLFPSNIVSPHTCLLGSCTRLINTHSPRHATPQRRRDARSRTASRIRHDRALIRYARALWQWTSVDICWCVADEAVGVIVLYRDGEGCRFLGAGCYTSLCMSVSRTKRR